MVKKTKRVEVSKKPKKASVVAGRMTPQDAEILSKLAEEAGVGTSTFVRLILERYLEDHASELRRVKKQVGKFKKKAVA